MNYLPNSAIGACLTVYRGRFFIVNDLSVAIEAKSARRISSHHLKGLRQLKKEHPDVKRLVVVCLEDKPRRTDDGIEIIPVNTFAQMLWQGELF